MSVMHVFDEMIMQTDRCYCHLLHMESSESVETAKIQMLARRRALQDARDAVYRYDLRFNRSMRK